MTERRSIRAVVAPALAGACLVLAVSAAGPVASASADNWNRRTDIIYYWKHRSWIRNERTGGEVLFSQEVNETGYGHGSGRYEWGSRLNHR